MTQWCLQVISWLNSAYPHLKSALVLMGAQPFLELSPAGVGHLQGTDRSLIRGCQADVRNRAVMNVELPLNKD